MVLNGSSFEMQEETIRLLSGLSEKYGLTEGFNYIGLIKLSNDVKIELESLVRILAGLQGITPAQRKRIRYLSAIKLGKVHFPGPKPGIPESSAFFYLDSLYGKKDPYLDPVYWDKLTYFVTEEEYDGALTRVRNKINKVLDGWYKTLHVEPADYISVATLTEHEIPEKRVFELNVIDRETGAPQYALSYFAGEVQIFYGNLPLDKIVAILKMEGAWE